MKITKSQLKQIIKEELENIQEVDIESMSDMEKVKIVLDGFVQIGINFSPALVLSLILLLVEQYSVPITELLTALKAKYYGASNREEK